MKQAASLSTRIAAAVAKTHATHELAGTVATLRRAVLVKLPSSDVTIALVALAPVDAVPYALVVPDIAART